jgi:hypothetical protein
MSVANNLAPFDKQVANARRTCQKQSGRVPAACAFNAARIPNRDISAFAGHQATAIGATEHICATSCRDLKGFAGRHGIRPVRDALQQHRLSRLSHQVADVIAGRTVDTKANLHAAVPHDSHRSDT